MLKIDYISHRSLLLVVACLQSFLYSGILYGWAALYTIFLETGVYQDRCPTKEICDDQKTALQWMYTVGASANLASQLLWGMILDRFGPRICFATSSLGVMIGVVLLGLSSPVFDAYMAAVVLFGSSGPGVQISLFHISELFPMQKSTVLSLISGAFQLSFLVFLMFRVLSHALGFTLAHMCFVYAAVLLLFFLIGVLAWPDAPCTPPPGEASPLINLRRNMSKLDEQSLGEQLCSGTFFGVMVWMTVCLFWANFYIGTVVEQLYFKSGEEPVPTRTYSTLFNLLLPIGVVGIPFFGWVTDKYGFTTSILLTSGLAIVFSGINLSSSLPLQVATFIAYSFFRTFLFSLMFSYLASEFGFAHFGRLSGVLLGVGGVIGLLNYPLHLYQASGALNAVNMIQFASLGSTILFAFYHARRVQAGLEFNSPWTTKLKTRRLPRIARLPPAPSYDSLSEYRYPAAEVQVSGGGTGGGAAVEEGLEEEDDSHLDTDEQGPLLPEMQEAKLGRTSTV